MRKTLVILLISVHLLGNTEASQLLKLPQLVSHFFQHHRIDPSINFFEFLAMHYSGDDGTTADDDFDKQLPCHNRDHNTMAVVYSPMVKETHVVIFPSLISKDYNSRLQSGVASKHVLVLLQPPKVA